MLLEAVRPGKGLSTNRWLARITLGLGLGLVLGVLLYLLRGEPAGSALFRGDFPAFYAAAEIVWTGRGSELYDFDLQREVENRHWPDFAGTYYIFAYPPFFALLLAPLAALTPLAAKTLAMFILFAALLGALLLIRRTSPFVREHFALVLVLLVTFAPLQMALFGVQNTSLTILLFSLVHWASRQGFHVLAGFSAALMLYKPQFGALLFLFLLGGGQKNQLLGWGLGALTLYLLGTLVQGPSWPLIWLRAATTFGDLNFTINAGNMISLAGLMYWSGEAWQGTGARLLPWAYGIAACLLLLAMVYVRRDPRRFVLAPHLVLWLSPQTLFYDIAVSLVCLVQDFRAGSGRDLILFGLLWLYGMVALLLRDGTSFPLFSPLLLSLLAIHMQRTRIKKTSPAPHTVGDHVL